jgi:hypothetical protein
MPVLRKREQDSRILIEELQNKQAAHYELMKFYCDKITAFVAAVAELYTRFRKNLVSFRTTRQMEQKALDESFEKLVTPKKKRIKELAIAIKTEQDSGNLGHMSDEVSALTQILNKGK